MANECDCGYYNKICIFCGTLDKDNEICNNGHINTDLKNILKYRIDFYTTIKNVILTTTDITESYYDNKTCNILYDIYKKCIEKLKYMKLDYAYTIPFLVETAVNKLIGENKPRQLIYPFHYIMTKEDDNANTKMNNKNFNKNVELFVKSFQILACISNISRHLNDLDNMINKLVIKPNTTDKYTYLFKIIQINHDGFICVDDSLDKFVLELKDTIPVNNYEWLIYKLGLYEPSGEGHANVLIVNKLDPTNIKIIYFEPHGNSMSALGYRICYEKIHTAIFELLKRKDVKNKKINFRVYPKNFNDTALWQTSEDFCASWCLLFLSIVLLNPNLSMVNMYELFNLKDEKVRYLLLYKFLFWYCNTHDYIQDKIYSSSKNSKFLSNINHFNKKGKNNNLQNNNLQNNNLQIIDTTKKYYCRKIHIDSLQYNTNILGILNNIYDYKNKLTELHLMDLYFKTIYEFPDLTDLNNLTKLTLTGCLVSGDAGKVLLPLQIKKLVLYENYDNANFINSNIKLLEYIKVDNITDELLLYIITEFKNIYLHTNVELSSLSGSSLHSVQKLLMDNNNFIINREDFFYKPRGELDNFCSNCEFNNELEEMLCIKCYNILDNINSLRP
jgi:hypothetical protein